MSIARMIENDLGLEDGYIESLSAYSPTLYKSFSCGGRLINAPFSELKIVQDWIAAFIRAEGGPVPPYATAYETDCSVVRNAVAHQTHAHLLALDIRHFFESCREDLVKSVFLGMRYRDFTVSGEPELRVSEGEAILLTTLSCYKGGLAMGAPSSPFLANRIMAPVDSRIVSGLSQRMSYTRYSDDICISSDAWIDFDSTIALVSDALDSIGLELNEKKTRLLGKGNARRIAGVYITSDGRLTIGPKKKRELKRELYDILLGKTFTYAEIVALIGRINYCRQVDPAFLNSLLAKYASYGLARNAGGVMPALSMLVKVALAK